MENFVAIPFSDYQKFAAAICQKAGRAEVLELPDLMKAVAGMGEIPHPEVGLVATGWNEKGYITHARWYGDTVPSGCCRMSNAQVAPMVFTAIEEIDLKGVVTIQGQAFAGCTNLTDIKNMDSVQVIYSAAFANCSSLTEIRLPGTITEMQTAFATCNKLTDIYVPWDEGEIAGAPWGATNATIHYNSDVEE